MEYTALYRKLRPKDFSEIIGQDYIVKILLNQIKNNKVSHAYLFSGMRGTGKTSLAKVFAKSINCTNKIEGNPCNKCKSCLSINNNRSTNVIEIDAASNNGVENIREIKEEVRYVPTEGYYKVYIIDEVHMLSIGAFNALLKTLEEPPAHVIFILATTEPQKIPLTINSRCQKFEFKRIISEDMIKAIKFYMEKEKLEIEDEALRYIVKISEGSMRDVLSLLDKCISFYYEEYITLDKIINIFGSADREIFFNLTEAILNYNSEKCIKIIEELIIKGKDINQFVNDFILHLRNLLMVSKIGKNTKLIDLSKEELDILEKQAKGTESDILINYIDVFSDLQSKFKLNSNYRTLLEIECIRLCNPNIEKENNTLKERILKLEKTIENRVYIDKEEKENIINIKKDNYDLLNEEDKKEYIEKAIPEDIEKVINSWDEFINKFENLIKNLLKLSIPSYLEKNILCIVTRDEASQILLNNKEQIIKEELLNTFNKEFEISFICEKKYNIEHKKIFGKEDDRVKALKIYKSLEEKVNTDID